ncbi:hypothetical protein [Nannocystis pusilla]|uniref:hypothetical protein n=1 Tax=Nannocystis pusilla TaxID=889268 RepID=UPI003B803393
MRVVSSQGTTELRWHRPLWQRIAAHLRLSLRYAQLAELRRQALDAQEPAARAAYARVLREQYGVELYFVPHPAPGASLARTAPSQLLQLFGANEARAEPVYTSVDVPLTQSVRITAEVARAVSAPQPAAASAMTGLGALLIGVPLEVPDLGEPVLADIFTLSGSSQTALALFLAALAAMLFIGTYLRTRAIARDRAAIPLVIGGWGTRGKSGTERLKAGLFHGLGYRVFAKTTGCEAMFIHAQPRGQAMEIYTFRPYGKATIWEQRTLLNLAAKTGSDVFLWECMALNPAYVEILQHHWMRDDAATITNCYPDHEDIQGPAGMDVAEVISRFVPTGARTVTSEINFLPVLRDAAGRRGSDLDAIDEFAGDLLPADLLALIPYEEHPRNVALVARLAEHLGLDRTLAIATMAEHVVPDLGVLKRYGPARMAGRTLEFINGCSANERAGFLSNWRRTGCDRLDLEKEPDRYVITVVNNREDRVARSQVFARLLVEDVAADRHVLIGTNTQGLVGYIREALEGFLAAQEIVSRDDLSDGPAGRARPPAPGPPARARAPDRARGPARPAGDLRPWRRPLARRRARRDHPPLRAVPQRRSARQHQPRRGAGRRPQRAEPVAGRPGRVGGCPRGQRPARERAPGQPAGGRRSLPPPARAHRRVRASRPASTPPSPRAAACRTASSTPPCATPTAICSWTSSTSSSTR